VAKILVADDNSNIQKMVGLALKDQGIDVVAVGNGEAAVRKISDIRPDLVLADVFMPVRNGYEVCQYVKEDPTLAHIPVILLLGAFDPLDEQEAQRVGADGVLKKPFVPPDPLIAMVKSALLRAGVAVPGSAPEKVAPPVPPPQAVDLLASRTNPPWASPSTDAPAEPAPPQRAAAPELVITATGNFVDEVPGGPAAVKLDSGSQHVAFESLLSVTPTVEAKSPSFVSGAHDDLPPVHDWRDSEELDEPEEEEEEEISAAPWRPEVAPGDTASGAGTAGVGDWRDAAFTEPPERKSARELWEPAKEENGLADAAVVEEATEVMASEAMTEVTAEPQDAPVAPFSGDAWAAAIAAGSDEQTSALEERPAESAPVAGMHGNTVEEHASEFGRETHAGVAESTAEHVEEKTEEKVPGNSWFTPPVSSWEAEANKASTLTPTWDAPRANTSHEADAQPAHESQQEPDHSLSVASSRGTGASQATVEQNMDELVARVLARMTPEALQAVTREILKPVVAALLREELKPKD
jgi:CheY-like chemotaxis protein